MDSRIKKEKNLDSELKKWLVAGEEACYSKQKWIAYREHRNQYESIKNEFQLSEKQMIQKIIHIALNNKSTSLFYEKHVLVSKARSASSDIIFSYCVDNIIEFIKQGKTADASYLLQLDESVLKACLARSENMPIEEILDLIRIRQFSKWYVVSGVGVHVGNYGDVIKGKIQLIAINTRLYDEYRNEKDSNKKSMMIDTWMNEKQTATEVMNFYDFIRYNLNLPTIILHRYLKKAKQKILQMEILKKNAKHPDAYDDTIVKFLNRHRKRSFFTGHGFFSCESVLIHELIKENKISEAEERWQREEKTMRNSEHERKR